MNRYNAYEISSAGRYIRQHEIIAADDETALAIAWRLVGDNDIEIWRQRRYVARLWDGKEKQQKRLTTSDTPAGSKVLQDF